MCHNKDSIIIHKHIQLKIGHNISLFQNTSNSWNYRLCNLIPSHTAPPGLCLSCCWARPPPGGYREPWLLHPRPQSFGYTLLTHPGSRWLLGPLPPARYLVHSHPGRSYRVLVGMSEGDIWWTERERELWTTNSHIQGQTQWLFNYEALRLKAAVHVVWHKQQHAQLFQGDELHVPLITLTHL